MFNNKENEDIIYIKNLINPIIKKYIEKDFFNIEDRVNTQVNNWKNALNWEDIKVRNIAEKYTQEEIIKFYRQMFIDDTYNTFLDFWMKVYNKNLDILDNLYYQNKLSLEIFTAITWIETSWYSNKKLNEIKEHIKKEWSSN